MKKIRCRKKSEVIHGSDIIEFADGYLLTVPDKSSLWLGREVNMALKYDTDVISGAKVVKVWETDESNKKFKIASLGDCSTCKKITEFIYSSKIDPSHSDSKDWLYSCRGIASDYRTCECIECGSVRTFDFSRD
jgi:hypothetical protein